MFRWSGLAGLAVAAIAGPVLFSGCVGFTAAGGAGAVPALATAEVCRTEPTLASDPARLLPSAGYSTIYANGIVWIGYNVATAEGGGLGAYDNGEGVAFGLAFGDGQNLKRFFELGFESTDGHKAHDTSGAVISTATHQRAYAGIRRYIFPVSEESGGRVVPFVVGGVCLHTIEGSSVVPTEEGDVGTAQGAGLYVGTGLEFKLGTSSQIALALDIRGSVIDYDGSPEGTGTQTAVGTAISVILHF